MSFAYLTLYTGDYLRDTRHLTPLKHGIYLLALMHCWDSKGPMPLDEQECAGICNCRSADEIEALRYVLNRYFVRMDDGIYNKRMAEEVARAEMTSMGRRAGGLKSAQARREKARAGTAAKREQELNKSSTQVEDVSVSPTPTPTPQRQEKKIRASRATSPQVERPEGVSEQVWNDWLRIRKEKRAPLTATAWEGVKREAAIAGITPAEAVRHAAESGWQGFKAAWLKRDAAKNGHASMSFAERTTEAKAQRIAELTGGLANSPLRTTKSETIDVDTTEVHARRLA